MKFDLDTINDGRLCDGALDLGKCSIHDKYEELQNNFKKFLIAWDDKQAQFEKVVTLLEAYEQRMALFQEEIKTKDKDIYVLLSILDDLKQAKDKEEMNVLLDNFHFKETKFNFFH